MKALEPSEAAAFASFHQLCTEQGLLRTDGLATVDVDDGFNDEITLLRYLQARKLNPSDALQQFKEATAFHAEKRILPLYDSIGVDDYEDTRKLYPHWTGRRDKCGLPIMMIDVAHLNNEAMTHWRKTRDMPCQIDLPSESTPQPGMAQRAGVFLDGLTRFILPLCTAMPDRPNPKVPVTKSVYIVDASSLSIKQAWGLRDFAQDISWILSTCYPETIKYIFVCNVSAYFSMIWNVLKKFIDPVTAEKMVVLKSSDVHPTLKKHLDPANIPAKFGGGFVFENGMLPDLDKNIRQSLQWATSVESTLPPGPVKWVQDDEGNGIMLATGSVGGLKRTEEVAALDVKE